MNFIIILWLLIILFSILLIKQLNIKANTVTCIIISILIITFVININDSIKAALEGCQLWYKAILPTTFPFVIICNLLIYYDGINIYSKILGPIICKPLGLSASCSFPIAASILCGYPLGAKYCAHIYSLGYIDKEEYSRLLNIASNVGPLFLIGSVAAALLNNIIFGYILLVGNYLSCIIIGLLTNKKKRTFINKSSLSKTTNQNKNFGSAIKYAIENGINTTLTIGGFIVIFSVIISLIKNNNIITYCIEKLELLLGLTNGTLYAFVLGSIEITNGCNIISSLQLPIALKLSIISFLCSFSGLAIIAQVSSFVSETKVNYKKYIFLKILQGFLSFIITYSLVLILPLKLFTSSLSIDTCRNNYIFIFPALSMLVLSLIFLGIHKLFLHIT